MMKTVPIVQTLGTLWIALAIAACGTSSSGGNPDGGSAGVSSSMSGGSGGDSGGNGGSSGGGSGGTSGSGGSSGSSGASGSGTGGTSGSGGSTPVDGGTDSMVPTDGGGGGEVADAKVFYFGHSLVGHDMPQMIGALARARGKTYAVNGQIGFGTPIQSHWRWEGDFNAGFVPVGFSEELPDSLLFDMDGHTALESGDFDVIVITESNGFVGGSPGDWNEFCTEGEEFGGCSISMTTNLVRKARMNNSAVRPFIYSNWKNTEDDVDGIDNWVPDIEDNVGWWENLADKVEAQLTSEGVTGPAIRVIPAALILARLVSEARNGELSEYGIDSYTDLFIDNVHLSRTGFYVIALTHYAAFFRESPVGLPNRVDVASGDKSSLEMNGFELDADLATYLQTVVWEELQAYPRSGVND